MALRNVTQLLSNEADIQLAISFINARQVQGNRPAATVYNVAETTLRWCTCPTRLPAQLEEA